MDISFQGPEFVLAIIAIGTIGWIATTFARARHGYPVENEWGGTTARSDTPDAKRATELIAAENAALKAQVARLEERLVVLERILTDPARRVASEIDALR